MDYTKALAEAGIEVTDGKVKKQDVDRVIDVLAAIKVVPSDEAGISKQGTLSDMTVQEITKILGFEPNIEDDPNKVVNSWGFTADGKPCGIFDYYGSHKQGKFSTSGPDEVFKELFGGNYSRG